MNQVRFNLDFTKQLVLPMVGLMLGAVVLGGTARAQGTNVPAFEVVSVRPTKFNNMISTRFVDNGISYTSVSTQILIRRALGVEDDRIFGMPGWAKADKYDLQARVSDLDVPKWQDLARDQKGTALLPILVSRFNLKFHHETRVLPVYALVIAKNGPKFHEAKLGEVYPHGINGPNGPEGRPGASWVSNGKLTAQAITIANLVHILSMQLPDHTIFDKTGLTGRYDFLLEWASDYGSPSSGADDASDATGPSLFTALQEQLGLKLAAQKVPIDVIVIDRIGKPSEN